MAVTLGAGAGTGAVVTSGVALGEGVLGVAPELAVPVGLGAGCETTAVAVGLGIGDPVVAEAGATAPRARTPAKAAAAQMRPTDVLVNESPKNHKRKVVASHWAGR